MDIRYLLSELQRVNISTHTTQPQNEVPRWRIYSMAEYETAVARDPDNLGMELVDPHPASPALPGPHLLMGHISNSSIEFPPSTTREVPTLLLSSGLRRKETTASCTWTCRPFRAHHIFFCSLHVSGVNTCSPSTWRPGGTQTSF